MDLHVRLFTFNFRTNIFSNKIAVFKIFTAPGITLTFQDNWYFLKYEFLNFVLFIIENF